jgi:sugar (pentulose or hexulose) kinase
MKMRAYLSADIGTTNIKAAAYDEDWKLIHFHSIPNPVSSPKPGWGEFDPEKMWEAVAACLEKVAGRLGGRRACSIGISSMAEAGLPLDLGGKPLFPIIAWYDPRAKEQYAKLEKKLGAAWLYGVSGQVPSDKYGICKLLWIRDRHPGVVSRMAHWLSVQDWIIYRLTGRYATDYSIAARTMAYDIRRLCWSEPILSAAGLDAGAFPPVCAGGTAVGPLLPGVAARLGLPGGVTVATGGHDHACAAIGVSILDEGVVLDSMGTAEASMIAVSEPPDAEAALAYGYSCYPHCGEKLYRVHGSIQSCGAAIEWLLTSLFGSLAPRAGQGGQSRYALLSGGGARSGNDGLFFFPFVRGSIEGSHLKGAFVGISDAHLPGDFADSLVDGLCYEFKRQLEGYRQISDNPCDALRVVGGLSRDERLMERKAGINGLAIEIPALTESACLGAAILGAAGAGAVSLDGLSAYACGKKYDAAPDPRQAERYSLYIRLRAQIKELFLLYGRAS